ncbi:hypothetical protein [Brevibacillus porteri]|uniref:hypothetical protein n=1 Tax=Brevibacillus porteri TaxID=2126350 RepID=UPI003D1CF32D
MDSEGTNSKKEGFKIAHYPQIVLSTDATEDQVQSAYEAVVTADHTCEVGNLLKKGDVQIHVEGNVSFISEQDVISEYVEDHGLDWN